MLELVGENEFKFLIGLLLSLIAGFLIGSERESKNKPTGISTITLVIAGSMAFTYLSGVVDLNSTSRIAAQVVTGVGFIGAGIILKGTEGRKITNVTTAATIWFAASIGMTIGFGYYIIAVIMIIFAFLVPRIPHVTDLKLIKKRESKDLKKE